MKIAALTPTLGLALIIGTVYICNQISAPTPQTEKATNVKSAQTETTVTTEVETTADDIYDAAINPHRKDRDYKKLEGDSDADCVEGEKRSDDQDSILPRPNDITYAVPLVGEIINVISMSDEEIIAYLDAKQPPTTFDLQHSTLYFDHRGHACGEINPDERYYFATSSGHVYQLNNTFDADRIGTDPLTDREILAVSKYVGETNRRLR